MRGFWSKPACVEAPGGCLELVESLIYQGDDWHALVPPHFVSDGSPLPTDARKLLSRVDGRPVDWRDQAILPFVLLLDFLFREDALVGGPEGQLEPVRDWVWATARACEALETLGVDQGFRAPTVRGILLLGTRWRFQKRSILWRPDDEAPA